jgi:two-component system OmpR family sensor kinase
MNRHSLFVKLNILFSIAMAAVFTAGYAWWGYLQKRERAELFLKSRVILREIRQGRHPPVTLFDTLNLTVIKGENREKILLKGKRPKRKHLPAKRMGRRPLRRIIRYRGESYLHISPPGNRRDFLLKLHDDPWRRRVIPILVFGGVVLLLTLMYLMLRRSLLPIRKLEREILRYGKGDLETRDFILQKGDDEISRLARAFYDSADKIDRLNRSRRFFLRNLLHELNTPVTKGKLLAEISTEPQTRKMLHSIFGRLSLLLEELAEVERITAAENVIQKRPVRIIDLIEQARDRLYLENSFPVEVGNGLIMADFHLMATVFKNLIDNGLKYGENFSIRLRGEELEFTSEGKPLEHPLEWYTEAFRREEKSFSGFGLGLYIVKEILKRHEMEFLYRSEKGRNIFVIKPLKQKVEKTFPAENA